MILFIRSSGFGIMTLSLLFLLCFEGKSADTRSLKQFFLKINLFQLGLDPIFEHFFSAAVGSSQSRGPGGRMGPTARRGRRYRMQGRPQVVMGTGDQFLQVTSNDIIAGNAIPKIVANSLFGARFIQVKLL